MVSGVITFQHGLTRALPPETERAALAANPSLGTSRDVARVKIRSA
jgi:hypothetical protein